MYGEHEQGFLVTARKSQWLASVFTFPSPSSYLYFCGLFHYSCTFNSSFPTELDCSLAFSIAPALCPEGYPGCFACRPGNKRNSVRLTWRLYSSRCFGNEVVCISIPSSIKFPLCLNRGWPLSCHYFAQDLFWSDNSQCYRQDDEDADISGACTQYSYSQ